MTELFEKAMCFECSGVGGYHDGGWVDCHVCDGSGLKNQDDLIAGTKVEINNPLLREHSKSGVVRCFDSKSDFYYVVFCDGPPWRGYYERSELERRVCDDQKL